MSDAPQPRRRLRYSLRTLLVLMTIVGIWFGYQTSRAMRQRNALEQLSAVGYCEPMYYFQQRDDAGETLVAEPGPKWLVDLLGIDHFAKVVRLNIDLDPDKKLPDLSALRDLQVLSLRADGLDDAGLKQIADLQHLYQLSLYFQTNEELTDEAFRSLAKLSELRFLNLTLPKGRTKLTGKCLEFVGDLPGLTQFYLNVPPFEAAAAIEEVGRCRKLEWFMLDFTAPDGAQDLDAALAPLAKLKSLQLLQISNTAGQGLRSLANVGRVENLDHLIIDGMPGDSVAPIAGLKKLERLEFANMPDLTDGGLEVLAELPRLKYLEISHCPEVSFRNLRVGSALDKLSIEYCDLDDEGFLELAAVPSLRSLTVVESPRLTVATLPNLPQLEMLSLWGKNSLGSSGFAGPENLPALRALWLDAYEATDEMLESIAQLPCLETIRSIRLSKATDHGLLALAGAKHLTHLELHVPPQSQVTDEAIDQLRKALPKCEIKLDRD